METVLQTIKKWLIAKKQNKKNNLERNIDKPTIESKVITN